LSSTAELACPGCGQAQVAEEGFCSRCGMPLVAAGGDAGEAPVSEAQARARKINPEFTEGRLVRVAGSRNQAEAELIQGMLLEEGVPSVLQRSAGFDVPDFLAGGPRDVMVPEAGSVAAREVLLEADLAPPAGGNARPHAGKLTAVVVAALGLSTLAAWLLQRAA
jgi:hypothetical protein